MKKTQLNESLLTFKKAKVKGLTNANKAVINGGGSVDTTTAPGPVIIITVPQSTGCSNWCPDTTNVPTRPTPAPKP